MRAITYLILASLPVVLSVAVSAMGATGTSPVENSGAAAPQVQRVPSQPRQEETELRDQVARADRRALVLEARRELEEDAYARFQSGMEGLGILITLLVVGFGFVTHRAAVNAARLEISDLKNKVQAIHMDAELAKTEAIDAATSAREAAEAAREAAEAARAAAEGALVHQRTAEQASEKIEEAAALANRFTISSAKGERIELSEAERETISDAVREVANKPEREWTSDDFRVKILEARQRRDWDEVQRLAGGMDFLYGANPEHKAHALFQHARALEESGNRELASAAYHDLVVKLGESDNPTVRDAVAAAMVNQSIALCHLHKNDEAAQAADRLLDKFGSVSKYDEQIAKSIIVKGIVRGRLGDRDNEMAAYDAVIERFGLTDQTKVKIQVSIAMYNKAVELRDSGELRQAIDVIDDLISRFGDADEIGLKAEVADALLFKARLAGKMGKVRDSISALDRWQAFSGKFDCDKVVHDSDFNPIRGRASFVRYLQRHGCSV